jgi:hypothetical protein
MSETRCPICLVEGARQTYVGTEDSLTVHCPRCRTFHMTGSAGAVLSGTELHPQQRANASAWLAESSPNMIDSRVVKQLLQIPTPTISQRLERLMIALVDRTTCPGQAVDLNESLIPVAYAQDFNELSFYLRELAHRGLLENKMNDTAVTTKGFEFVEDLTKAGRHSPVGFCAMAFAPELLPLWTDVIEPAITAAGYEAKRMDTVEHNNRIDEEILAWIRRSRFLVADITKHRNGVYFEAGFAMGLGLPVVWMVSKEDAANTHFDNRQYNRIEWADADFAAARKALFNRIVATIGEGPLPTKREA